MSVVSTSDFRIGEPMRWPSAMSYLYSAGVCVLIMGGFILASRAQLHWYLVPVFFCGAIMGADAIGWLTGRYDVFDPKGILGLLGYHFFFLAPLLHVHWDYWMSYVVPPQEWRDWMGAMAALNAIGLILFSYASNSLTGKLFIHRPLASLRVLNGFRFSFVLVAALLLTAGLQAGVYIRFGGLDGYIEAFEERSGAFEGMGWIFSLSESFPILLVIAYVFHVGRSGRVPTWTEIILVLFMFVVLKFLFGGLRGSRSNTLWGVFWATAIIHFLVRRLPRKLIISGAVACGLFVYAYGFYKYAGREALEALTEAGSRQELEERSGRSLRSVLLTDLGRSDVQAFLLFKTAGTRSDYELAWGRSYAGALALLIPKSVWPDRPQTKRREGTDVQYGRGTFDTGYQSSSRQYGLAGEAMLNFGPLGVPFAFIVFGCVVGAVRYVLYALPPHDARWLVLPLFINLCMIMLTGDSDNLVFFLVKNGAVPLLLLWVGQERVDPVEEFAEPHSEWETDEVQEAEV